MSEVTNTQSRNYTTKEANEIQAEIEVFTKKIEHEKINLRLSDERFNKQLENYFILCGKPIPKTKEQKEKERKEREKMKKEKTRSLSKTFKKDSQLGKNNIIIILFFRIIQRNIQN